MNSFVTPSALPTTPLERGSMDLSHRTFRGGWKVLYSLLLHSWGTLRDMIGREVGVISTIGSGRISVDVGGLRAGAYNITLYTIEGPITARFIKN